MTSPDSEVRMEIKGLMLDPTSNVPIVILRDAESQLLLPIWIAAYEYLGKSYRYVVNGATGQATGTAPWSWIKIGLAALAALVILSLIAANQ